MFRLTAGLGLAMLALAAIQWSLTSAGEPKRVTVDVEASEPHRIVINGLATDGVIVPNTPEPSPTAIPEPTAVPTLDAPVYGFAGEVTHYGESYNGLTMGCGGIYWSWDTTIVAVAYPGRNGEWPCGTHFRITGPTGIIDAIRTDACPGCNRNQLDLSESGMLAVCGYLGRCPVWIEVR